MSDAPIVYEHSSSCKVTCKTEYGENQEWSVYVPSRLLWSAGGMAELFRICRLQLANPEEYPGDDDLLETWQSFHITKIEEDDGFVLDIDWEES